MSEYHTPVLLNESVEALAIKPDGIYADATFGGGGHSLKILSMLGRKGRLIAFDKDFDALANAPADDRLTLIHNNFKYIHHLLRAEGYGERDRRHPGGPRGLLAPVRHGRKGFLVPLRFQAWTCE
jgi:16S rRNA (cytosine1402-N4)-methyltransferase